MYTCTFPNLMFSICSVDGLNQILEYKNINDIVTHLHGLHFITHLHVLPSFFFLSFF